MTPQSTPSSWNLCRFLKTLAYFGAIPFFSNVDWIQQRLGSQVNPTVDHTMSVTNECIFDFRQPEARTSDALETVWGAVDDVVMGGVSTSGLYAAEDSVLFGGTVSTANSGGFASVRTRNFDPAMDLSAYDGLSLRVKGDGQRYKFLVRDAAQWDGVAYSYSFDTVAGEWITVTVPFSSLVPVFRARTVNDANQIIAKHQIRAFQFMLSKFEYDGQLNPSFAAGSFQLFIESVCPY